MEPEHIYFQIFNASSEAIFIHDISTGKILDVNNTMLRMYGLTKSEALNSSAADLSANDNEYNPENAVKYIREAAEKGKVVFPWLARKKNGELFWVEVSLVKSQIGSQDRIIAFVRELSGRTEREDVIKESNILYKTLFNNASDAIFLLQDGVFVDCNPQALEMFGCSREEILGKSPSEYSPKKQPVGENSTKLANEYIKMAWNGAPQRFKWQHKRKNGEVFDTEVSLNRVIIGGKDYVHAIVRDMTETYRYIEDLARSEAKFFSIFNQAFIGIAIYGFKEQKLIEMNYAFEKILQIPRNELMSKNLDELFSLLPEETIKELFKIYNSADLGIKELPLTFRTPSGNIKHLLISIDRIEGDDDHTLIFLNDVSLIIGKTREIEERSRFENMLQEISNRFINIPLEDIDSNIQDGLMEICKFLNMETGTLFFFNENFSRVDVSHLWVESGRRFRFRLLRTLEFDRLKWWRKKIQDNETIVINRIDDIPEEYGSTERKLFERFGLRTLISIPMVYEGKVIGMLGFDSRFNNRDWLDYELTGLKVLGQIFISTIKHKVAEESLVKSEALFRSVVQNMSDIIFILSKEATILYASPSTINILGYTPDEMKGKYAFDYAHPDDAKRLEKDFVKVIRFEKAMIPTVFRLKRKNGDWVSLEGMGTNLIHDKFVHGIVITARDITKRLRDERIIKETSEKYKNIFENIYDLYVEISKDGILRVLSPSVHRMTGYSPGEFIGKPFEELLADNHSWNEIREELERETIIKEMDITLRSLEKGAVPAKMTIRLNNTDGDYTSAIGSIRDISEHRLLEEQLLQSQKMEAVGRLAGGIAHDFNNILTAILGNADLALFSISDDEPVYNFLSDIKNAALKASRLTKQLLTFSKSDILEIKSLDINEILSGLEQMLIRLIPENIKVEYELFPVSPNVMADKGQLEQVIVNLVINAADAMPDGGTILLKSGLIDSDVSIHGKGKILPPGNYGTMEIIDTGIGIDENMADIIFEPFFTTKDPEKGTGLGLSVVYRIIEQHNGAITLKSEVGKGTHFTIYLPVANIAEKKTNNEENPEDIDVDGKATTILLVEDNPGVKKFVKASLERFNFQVVTAELPSEALSVLDENKEEIKLIITDVVMPEMNGRELVEKIYEKGIKIPVVYISGYTDNFIDKDEIKDENMYFIAKPFTVESLIDIVTKALKLNS